MSSKENFFQLHWDWLVAAAGVAALAGTAVFFAGDFSASPEEAVGEQERQLAAVRPAHDGVAALDDEPFRLALAGAKKPPRLADVDGKKANFLASERRLACVGEGDDAKKACGRPIPAEAESCPFCGVKQPLLVKVEIDSDHDGMPIDWEVKYDLNPNDPSDANADKDNDGFTNLEEFLANTDPTDAKSHPDYLDSLFVAGPLKQTNLSFYLREANQIPDGKGGQTWRCTFLRIGAKKYEDKTFSVKVGEAIKTDKIDSGWKLEKLERKMVEVAIKGGGGMKTKKELCEASIVRAADGMKLTVREGVKRIGVEAQASLVFKRGQERTFDVAEGSVFELFGVKYKVLKLSGSGKTCSVTVQCLSDKKQKTISGT